ncbi:MAG: hypothetical protein KAG66_04240, partial [Methylococcales bacterium]|nr:hypothetical protein [Methylococcales bacterium]
VSFRSVGSGGARSKLFGRGSGGADVQEFCKLANDILEDINMNAFEAKIIVLDRGSFSQLPYTVVSLLLKKKSTKASRGYVYIFAETLNGESTVRRDINRHEITVEKLPSRAFSANLTSLVKSEAAQVGYGSRDNELIVLDGLPIYKTITKINEQQVAEMISVGGAHCETDIEACEKGFTDIHFVRPQRNNKRGKNIKLAVDLEFPALRPVFESTGMPIRADLALSFSASTGAGRNDYKNHDLGISDESSSVVTRATGYGTIRQVDFSPVDHRDGDRHRYERFVRSVVITGVNSDSLTPASVFLSAAAAASMSGSASAADLFRPVIGGDGLDRDLGSLNTLACLPAGGGEESGRDEFRPGYSQKGTALNLNGSNNNNQQDVLRFLEEISPRGLQVVLETIDCSDASPTNYHFNLLGAGANSSSRKRSKEILWASLMDMTDGVIENNFNPSENFIMPDSTITTPSGYYIDSAGHYRSSSDIDLVTIVTAFHESDPSRINDYHRCLMNPDLDYEVAQSMLVDIYKEVTHNSFVVTGVKNARTINPALLSALIVSFEDNHITLQGVQRSGSSDNAWTSLYDRKGSAMAVVDPSIRQRFSGNRHRSSGGRRGGYHGR